MTHLGNVHGHDVSERADRKSGDESANKEVRLVHGASLEGAAEEKDEDVAHDDTLPSDAVTDRTTDQGTEPCAEQERGHEPSLLLALSNMLTYLDGAVGVDAREFGAKVLEHEHIAYNALVVPEEEAPKRSQEGDKQATVSGLPPRQTHIFPSLNRPFSPDTCALRCWTEKSWSGADSFSPEESM